FRRYLFILSYFRPQMPAFPSALPAVLPSLFSCDNRCSIGIWLAGAIQIPGKRLPPFQTVSIFPPFSFILFPPSSLFISSLPPALLFPPALPASSRFLPNSSSLSLFFFLSLSARANLSPAYPVSRISLFPVHSPFPSLTPSVIDLSSSAASPPSTQP